MKCFASKHVPNLRLCVANPKSAFSLVLLLKLWSVFMFIQK